MSNPHNYDRYADYDDQTRQFNPHQGGSGGYQGQGREYPQQSYDGYNGYGSGRPNYGGPQNGYPQNYGPGPQGAPRSPQGVPQGGPQGRPQNWGKQARSGLIAGRFDAKKVIVNLIVLGILAAAVTFAAVFVVDLIVSQFGGSYSMGTAGEAIVVGAIAGLVGVFAGLLYIPVVGTGNEHLFGLAVIALAVVAAVVWVLFGGLLDGDWTTLITLTGIIGTATTALATRARIEAADVTMRR
ncbi:proline-rich domain-containing protein [Corynebacterium anserum]|uniref:proline-rich domain-containing protein n=1 Tax=Corynebacterium anserum TaxID=2684406 RepID=UPI00163A2136|nr:hypothetical protein [Corynebacterium anserum]